MNSNPTTPARSSCSASPEKQEIFAARKSQATISSKAGAARSTRLRPPRFLVSLNSSARPPILLAITRIPFLARRSASSTRIPTVSLAPGCTYCGFCESFGCMTGAKAQPTNILLPIIAKRKNVSVRTGATVRRIVQEASQKNGKARGVRYVDATGQEFFQPADLVSLASWTLNNTRLLLLSGIGEPYDPIRRPQHHRPQPYPSGLSPRHHRFF